MKFIWTLGMLGGIIGEIMMWNMDIPREKQISVGQGQNKKAEKEEKMGLIVVTIAIVLLTLNLMLSKFPKHNLLVIKVSKSANNV